MIYASAPTSARTKNDRTSRFPKTTRLTQATSDCSMSADVEWERYYLKHISGQETGSIPRLLLEQIKQQQMQIAEMKCSERASNAKHQATIEDIRRSYDQELLRLQALLTKTQEARMVRDLNPETADTENLDLTSKPSGLEKELKFQSRLIQGYQKENEMLVQENKKLKQKLASALVPTEDANATAERLARENARLQIDLQRATDELQFLKTSHKTVWKDIQSQQVEGKEAVETTSEQEDQAQLKSDLQETIQRLEDELKQSRSECNRLKARLTNMETLWAQDANDDMTEIKKTLHDNEAAMMRLKEKLRRQDTGHTTQNRHLATIRKQRLEIMKLKTELNLKQTNQPPAVKATRRMPERRPEVQIGSSKPGLDNGKQSLGGRTIHLLQKNFDVLKREYEEYIRVLEENLEVCGKSVGTGARPQASAADAAAIQSHIDHLRAELNRRLAGVARGDAVTSPPPQPLLVDKETATAISAPRTAVEAVQTDKTATCSTSTAATQTAQTSSDGIANTQDQRGNENRQESVFVAAFNSSQKQVADAKNQMDIQRLKAATKLEALATSLARIPASTMTPSTNEARRPLADKVTRLCCELNVTRQRADRLQAQLDTLRRVHIAAITGQPSAEVTARLLHHLTELEQQQNRKSRRLEEYIQSRLVDAHTRGECPCSRDADVAASYWRRIAEKRGRHVALLDSELDKLTALLVEVSTTHPPPNPPLSATGTP
uniref:Centrosomal protein of 162 kDa n=3 Tax=Mesocestoides corti TaxID=53468 RepID=A0A5K3F2W6_MESCO